jgi:hypothetical protein
VRQADDGIGRHRQRRAWNVPVGLIVAVGLVAYVLAVVRPEQPDNPPALSGPVRLAEVWPDAKSSTLASALTDGSSYSPLLFLDLATSVGLTTSPDLTTARLVVLTADGAVRELRELRGLQRPTIAAVTAVGDQLFWIETGENGNGRRRTTIWRAGVGSGPPRQLASDSSDVVYLDSAYDIQVSDGYVNWAAAGTGAVQGGEIRSVAVDGGPVRIRKLDRLYTLSVWPWATSGGNGQPGDIDLLNLRTGERRTVAAGPNDLLNCTPSWCRVTTLVNRGQSLTVDVERTDGTGRRRIGDTALMPLNTDVALADRFEVLAGAVSTNAATTVQRLWLHDLTTSRSVVLADGATAALGSRGGFLWWSTGDNETLVWHVIDLRDLH